MSLNFAAICRHDGNLRDGERRAERPGMIVSASESGSRAGVERRVCLRRARPPRKVGARPSPGGAGGECAQFVSSGASFAGVFREKEGVARALSEDGLSRNGPGGQAAAGAMIQRGPGDDSRIAVLLDQRPHRVVLGGVPRRLLGPGPLMTHLPGRDRARGLWLGRRGVMSRGGR